MVSTKSIIVVGADAETNMPNLLSTLRAHGLDLVQARTTAELRALLREDAGATIIVHDSPGANTARTVLKTVAEAQTKVPVVVVAEHGNFEHYYDLMSEGAYDYFDLRDGLDAIERAVRWAAGSQP